MPNTSSAKKAVRVSQKRSIINRSRRTMVRTFRRKANEAIKSGNAELAKVAIAKFESEVMRAVRKGALKLNTASRYIHRLFLRLKVIKNSK